ncbi:hypothetical protein [Chlorogloea sp. CCALA 695]|uniref:hypothetical protein n=1 Tax=Chlorogloea sp. CCALA 695 TaxID=2107693 RepID=UPI000D054429|nr:hypothetical protein [Chlorogloea sp. CCALA 695]PSB30118.1 hypothetical protein C7B70_17125 [Chlorogloea sp. CCALA 695]
MREINDANYQKMAGEIVEIHTLFKEGLATRGLGAVIVERSWKIGYNSFSNWYRLPIPIYRTLDELECFKNLAIDVIGIDDFDPKGKNLIQLINEYGRNRVISAEMTYDSFWFQTPKNPSWRFLRVQVLPWDQPEANEVAQVFKLLGEL